MCIIWYITIAAMVFCAFSSGCVSDDSYFCSDDSHVFSLFTLMRGKLTVLHCAWWGIWRLQRGSDISRQHISGEISLFSYCGIVKFNLSTTPFLQIQAHMQDHRSITSRSSPSSETWVTSFKWGFVQVWFLDISASESLWNLTRDLWVGRIWKFDQIDWLWKLHDLIAAGTLYFLPPSV